MVVKNKKETEKVAINFASKLKGGEVVLLNGDLGAGKTTFTQFVFKYLGVEETVTSPTFAILKTYEGKFRLHHFDVYRIGYEEAVEAGFDEIFQEEKSIKFVEWSENIKPMLPDETIKINIKYLGENEREIEIYE